MDNILPKFKTFSLDEDKKKVNIVTDWVPALSKPPKRNLPVPYYLEQEFTKENDRQVGGKSQLNLAPPNERYVKSIYDPISEPSPLSRQER